MDEPLLTIVKAMAGGEMEYDDEQGIYCCLYCYMQGSAIRSNEIQILEIPHKVDCPVTLARQYLQGNNMSVNIYKMRAIHLNEFPRHATWHTIATSQEEAIQEVEKEGRCTNIRAELIRPLKIVVAE